MRHLSTLLILLSINISLMAQSVGVNLPDGTTANTMLDVNGGVSFREGTALTCINGVNSNIALANYSFYRVTGPTAAFSITGFGNGTDGRCLTIINASGQTMTLSHLTTSTTGNQINTGGSAVVLSANGVATLMYNANLTKWIVSGTMGTAPSFTSISNGSFSDSMIVINDGVPFKVRPVDYIETYAWGLDGNAGTVDGTNFLGTTDNIPLSIRVNNQKAGRIDHLLNNAFWGYQAGNAITSGTNNVAIGSTALSTMTTGNENVAIGGQSAFSNTTGVRNVSIGYQSARNGTHSNSVMIGYQAGLQNAASNNVFIGSLSGPFTSTGSDNIGMGYYTLFNNQTGKNNVAIGTFALSTTTAAWGNTAVGYLSSASIQTGQANTALGDSSLMNNVLGSSNTHLGYRAGLWTTGSNNIAIGANAALPVSTANNQLALGTWLYGTNSNLGINTIDPQYKLDIDANTGSTGNPLRLQGLQAGLTSDSIVSSSGGLLRRLSIAQVVGGAWSTTGNSGTTAGTNFVGTTNGQALVFKTNNTEGMRLSTSQNLGLGTTNPSFKLDVVGRSRFQTGGGSAGFWLTNSANTLDRTLYGMFDDNTVGIYSNATTSWGLAYKLTNGNIGMGLTTPEANLHLFGNGTSGYTPTGTTVMPNPGVGPEIAFSRGGAYKPIASVQLIDYNGFSGGLAFNVHKGTANSAGGTFADNWPTEVTQAMTIVNNGNIGIGTSDPSYKLDIDANTGSTGNPLRLQGLRAGLTSDSIVSSNGGLLRRLSIAQVVGSGAWSTTGNASTVDGTNFLGTTDNIPLSIRVNNQRSGYIGLPTTSNTYFGYQAGLLTTGVENTFIGGVAGSSNTTGDENTAVGNRSLQSNTTGDDNTAIGEESLKLNTTGISNTGLGESAMENNTTGSYNTGVGAEALFRNTDGDDNVAVGESAMESNTIGSSNVAIGRNVLFNNLTANRNIGIGYEAMFTQSFSNSGSSWDSDNIGIGYQALYANQPTSTSGYSGSTTVAVGNFALKANTVGYGNAAVGHNAMQANTTGYYQVALGESALYSNTTGTYNTAIGRGALYANVTGTDNTALGANTLGNTTSSYNTAVGTSALFTNTTGTSNIGIGNSALYTNSTGNNNVAIGNSTISNVSNQSNNTVVGDSCMASATADNNTGLGYKAGSNITSGGNNIAIGSGAQVPTATASNQLSIGNWIYGINSGNIGIGTTTPVNKLDVDGGAVIGATYSGTNTAPTNGLLVEGNVGIGTTTANTSLDVNGGLSIRPSTTVNLTVDNQAVTVGNSSFLVLSSNNATANTRTFTLSSGLQSGQVLVILLTLNGAELADSGNCNLTAIYNMGVGDTITLIWNGSTWYETARANN